MPYVQLTFGKWWYLEGEEPMILKCDKCNCRFTDGQIQVPNCCPQCGKTILSEAETTIVTFIRNNYLGFEYVPMLSTLGAEGIKQQLVIKCKVCDEVLRLSGLGSMSVENYCGGLIRQVLDRHSIKCKAQETLSPKEIAAKKIRAKNKFVEQPTRLISLEEE